MTLERKHLLSCLHRPCMYSVCRRLDSTCSCAHAYTSSLLLVAVPQHSSVLLCGRDLTPEANAKTCTSFTVSTSTFRLLKRWRIATDYHRPGVVKGISLADSLDKDVIEKQSMHARLLSTASQRLPVSSSIVTSFKSRHNSCELAMDCHSSVNQPPPVSGRCRPALTIPPAFLLHSIQRC